jgi:hypothetical protein
MTATKIDAGFGNWLAGFADGEGSFLISRQGDSFSPRFVIRLRDDDTLILEDICARLGVGTVARSYPPTKAALGHAPQVVWQVSNRASCLVLVDLFDRYPLRAKKAQDFTIWREAVLAVGSDIKDVEHLIALKRALERGRAYEGAPVEIVRREIPPSLFGEAA